MVVAKAVDYRPAAELQQSFRSDRSATPEVLGHGASDTVTALTSTAWTIDHSFMMRFGRDEAGQVCGVPTKLEFRAAMTPVVISMATELKGLTCASKAIYGHELEHLYMHKWHHAQISSSAVAEVQARMAEIPVMYGPTEDAVIAKTQQAAAKMLTAVTGGWRDELNRVNVRIDDDLDFGEFEAKCGLEMKEFFRRVRASRAQ